MTKQEMKKFAADQVEWYKKDSEWIRGQIEWINDQLKRTRKEDKEQKAYAQTYEGGKYAHLYEGNYQGEETRELLKQRRRYQRDLKKNAANIEHYKKEVEKYTETEETETTAPAEEQTTETETVTETEEMKEDTTVEKIKVVYEKKEGRTYTETWRSEKPEEVYERLAHCLIAKKLNNCGWIRSIKRVPLYNGFDRITITHDNGGRDVYTVASH